MIADYDDLPASARVREFLSDPWRSKVMKRAIFTLALLIATTLDLGAKTIQWPEKDPSFRITFPDGWKCQSPEGGGFRCKAEDNSGLHVDFTSTVWKTEQQAKAGLSVIAEKVTKALNLKEVEQREVRETMSSEKVKLIRLEAAGQMDGLGIVSWFAVFKIANNPYVGLSGAMKRGDAEHEKRIDQILSSIAPLAGQESAKRSTTDFNPYKGSVSTLLPPEMADSEFGLRFKLIATGDRIAAWKEERAMEAVGFTYNQTAIVIVKVNGVLVNFANSADAVAALKATAAENGATVTPKGNGQRFMARNGRIIAWTNGSLLCVLEGGTDPVAGVFEKAAPF